MQLVALILAKRESKRLPHKNILPFKGKKMFFINLEKCLKIFNEVYVSSDSEEILNWAEENGAIPILRGKELCGETPDIPVFQHALSKMKDVDGIIAVHANNPTIEINLIALTKKILEMGIEEVMTCHPMTKDMVYKKQANNVYGSIRGISRKRLLNYGDPYHPNPEVLIVDNSIEIETEVDYNLALYESNEEN